jgi:hypothetical protein
MKLTWAGLPYFGPPDDSSRGQSLRARVSSSGCCVGPTHQSTDPAPTLLMFGLPVGPVAQTHHLTRDFSAVVGELARLLRHGRIGFPSGYKPPIGLASYSTTSTPRKRESREEERENHFAAVIGPPPGILAPRAHRLWNSGLGLRIFARNTCAVLW